MSSDLFENTGGPPSDAAPAGLTVVVVGSLPGDALRPVGEELRIAGAGVLVVGGAPAGAEPDAAGGVGVKAMGEPFPGAGFWDCAVAGLREAAERGDHALLVCPVVRLFPGMVTEMLAGLEWDSMAGFVCPRSNNIPATALPPADLHIAHPGNLSPETAASLHAGISRRLPRFSFLPIGSGACLLVRREVLACLGLPGANPASNGETGLFMSANRLGYRVLAANRAYVHLPPDAAPAWLDPAAERAGANCHPEYAPACDGHRRTPQARIEVVLSERAIRSGSGRTVEILIDARALQPFTNGTARVTTLLARSLARRATGTDVRISAVYSDEAAARNALSGIPGLALVPEAAAYGFDLLLRPCQPFGGGDLCDSAARAVKNAFYMLDTIMWDCLYHWNEDMDRAWNLVAEHADALFFISPFGHDQFRRRFSLSSRVLAAVTPLSLDVRDYPRGGCGADPGVARTDILVFGNRYHHKFVGPTAMRLAAHFPHIRIVLLGMEEWTVPANVTAIPGGALDEDALERLFASAICLVYPSTYEGFGLPILEGLARGVPVLARDSELNRWIAAGTNAATPPHLFRTFEELVAKIYQILDAPAPAPSAAITASREPLIDEKQSMDSLWEAVCRLARSDDYGQFYGRKEFLRMAPPLLSPASLSASSAAPFPEPQPVPPSPDPAFYEPRPVEEASWAGHLAAGMRRIFRRPVGG